MAAVEDARAIPPIPRQPRAIPQRQAALRQRAALADAPVAIRLPDAAVADAAAPEVAAAIRRSVTRPWQISRAIPQ